MLRRFGGLLTFLILAVCLLYPTCQYRQQEALSQRQTVQLLDQWTWQRTTSEALPVELPYIFNDLSPHTPVTLTTTIANPGDYLLLKSIYTPFRVYANGELIYSGGTADQYPGFFRDPPTLLQLIPLPDAAAPIELRLEFLSPVQRDHLRVPAMETGDKADLLLPVFQQSSLSFILSLLLLFLSLLPIAAAIFLLKKAEIRQAFFQLGAFGFCSGIWGFAECNLTVFFLPYPSLLYILAFLGLFAFSIPLLKFGRCVLDLSHPFLLRLQIRLTQAAVLTAMALQYLGIIGFAQSVYFFHILLPLNLSVFVLQICRAARKEHNLMARRFTVPMAILAGAALLELLNYHLRFTNSLSFFFQLGSLLFILALGVLAIRFMQNSLRLREERRQMEFDLQMAERRTETQRTQYAILTEHERVLREQRHDLRHQLVVLKSFSQQGDNDRLQRYIEELTARIPVEKDMFLCSNFVVNSLVLYYQSIALEKDIRLNLQLSAITSKNGHIRDTDLCVILGNLLENAIEACNFLPAAQRYISLQSRIYDKKLILSMKNSYDGVYTREDGVFYSRKRDAKGIGLSSIESVVRKYQGIAKFDPGPDTFNSSVYLELTALPSEK